MSQPFAVAVCWDHVCHFGADLPVSAGGRHHPCPMRLAVLVCHLPAPGWEMLTCFLLSFAMSHQSRGCLFEELLG